MLLQGKGGGGGHRARGFQITNVTHHWCAAMPFPYWQQRWLGTKVSACVWMIVQGQVPQKNSGRVLFMHLPHAQGGTKGT